ncbi:hypothetical protein [Clostridium tetani]|nr:hypothetical protein [Clostridium tetani]WFN61236.1 hypothetical protein PAA20_09850 [Clostridium tetani]
MTLCNEINICNLLWFDGTMTFEDNQLKDYEEINHVFVVVKKI